jgi:protein kinase-like protein
MGSPLARPARIGKYDVTGVIGRGGMGIVYRATDPRIGRPVAIKVLTGFFSEDSELLARFYREAKSTGSLQHQNIVTVYELGDQDGFPYLVMEYLEGESLDSIIASRRPLSISEKLGIMIRVCDGLSFAHERGIIHRDIKPANIVVLTSGAVKIVDFGIAQVGNKRLTRTGQLVGSIYYMSPEQLNDTAELDARTDVYSAGVVLFQLLTGVLPFEGRDTSSTLLKIVRDPAPPLNKFISLFPAELETISQKALMKDRDQRYVSAEDFAFDLTRLRQQLNQDLLAEHLQKAVAGMQREDFASARQDLLEALRVDPQNARGKQLLREALQGMETQKRKQQALQLGAQAQEALSKKDLDTALQCAEQAVQLNGENVALRNLLSKVVGAREQAANYCEALARAERARQSGNLEKATEALAEAMAILPLDAPGRASKARIEADLAERLRKEKERDKEKDAQVAKRQFALAVNSVEKAMADARLQLYLNQPREAWEILKKASQEASQVPLGLRTQLEALIQQVHEHLVAEGPDATTVPPGRMETGRMENDTSAATEFDDFHSRARSDSQSTPRETILFPNQPVADDTSYLRTGAPPTVSTRRDTGALREELAVSDEGMVPEELREFLPPPPRRGWGRPAIWLGVGTVALAIGIYWAVFDHKGEPHPQPVKQQPSQVADVPYAEVNAGPWGMVKEVRSLDGQIVHPVNEETPLRITLPPGQYNVSLEGPNGEKKMLRIEVPEHGGNPYFVLFHKPDVQRIVNAK